MSDKLCVMLLTYNRLQYAEPTLRALLDNILWGGELRVHIADDGSPAGYAETLRAIAGGYEIVGSTGVSNSEHRGYGANYNLATQSVHAWADYVLPLEDDWVLTQELNVDQLVRNFIDTRIGCIRLGYLGFTQGLHGEIIRVPRGNTLLVLDPQSPEPHVFAGHPRIETVAWERRAGPWPEGLDPNMTEFQAARDIRRGIAWPMHLNPDGGLFEHIGTLRAR